MRPVARRGLLVAIAAAIAGCGATGGTPSGADDATPTGGGDDDSSPVDGDASTATNPAVGGVTETGDLDLTSPAFEDGGTIPDAYGRAYENVNPPLEISGVPDGAASLALVMDDPDAPGGTFDHWLAWNVPPDTGEVPEGWDPPPGVVQGENDFGNVGYDGPQPPDGEHTYRFKLYALATTLDLEAGAGKEALGRAMRGEVLARTQLDGRFAP